MFKFILQHSNPHARCTPCTIHTHTRARAHTHTHTHTDTHTGWHTHAQRHTRAHSLAQTYTPAHKFTHPHARNDTRARTHTHTHARNLFSRTFCTSREYCDYGYLKINGMDNTGSAISRREIDEIEVIQQGFQEYDFDLKISNWATRMKSFTCTTFLLLTASLLRISC